MESIVEVLWMGDKAQWVIQGVSVWAHTLVEYCVAWPIGNSQDPTRVLMECKAGEEVVRLVVTGGTKL